MPGPKINIPAVNPQGAGDPSQAAGNQYAVGANAQGTAPGNPSNENPQRGGTQVARGQAGLLQSGNAPTPGSNPPQTGYPT
jgi:hypothetical protein